MNLYHHSCFATLSQSVLISESLQHDDLHKSYLKKHFPNFMWLMRDSNLECRDDNGEEISATDYVLQKILVTNNKGDKPPNARDRAVSSVRVIFPKIESLQIPPPGPGITNPKKMKFIDPDFYTSIDSAKRHVVNNTPLKLGFNQSSVLDGQMLASLLDEYVQALNTPDTALNLEVSYQKAVEVTLTQLTIDLTNKYYKQMSELVDQNLPLEEGDIEVLQQTHSERLKESVKGTLNTCKHPIETVKPTDTLFEVHERVYTNMLRYFTIELHRLIPEAADTDEIYQKNEQTRKRQLLEKFEQLIINIDQSKVLGGYISHFTKPNTDKSESTCKEVFEKIYQQQIQTRATKREILQEQYYEKAVGPAKDKVFHDMISQIPGPPQNVVVDPENKMLSWEKLLVNTDAVNYYYVEWQGKEGDTKLEKVHTNQFKLEMLKPKTHYSMKVQGFNDHKNRLGEYSTEVTFQTKAGKPEKPTMLQISPQNEKTVKLMVTMLSDAQQNGSPVTNIIVSRRSDRKPNWESQNFPVDSSQGEFQTLEVHVNCNDNEEKLYYRVQLENEAGISEPSDSAQLDIADMIPGKPENIKTNTIARQIQVTWDLPIHNPGAVNSYLIQYWEKRDDQELNQSKKIARRGERSLQLTSLSPYTEYTIRVYARNEKYKTANGYGIVHVRTLADIPDTPHPPTIRVTSASKATITFYRQKPDEENGSPVNKIYIERQIKRAEQATKWTVVKEHPLIDSSQSDIANVNLPVELINLTESFISCYRVVTVNSIGRSEPSQPIEVHPESMLPGSPEGLKAVTTKSNSITISWKKTGVNPLASKQYQIQHKEAKGATWTSKKANAETYSCTVSELRPDTKYTFIVQAQNGSLMSEEATLNVRTPPSVPLKPRPPIVIPRGNEFTLKAHLPPVEESGREVTQLHVNYYSYDTAATKLTENYEIEQNKDEAMVQNNTHEQQIQVNIDETCWISICLSNEVGKSQESDLVGLSSGDVTPGVPDKLECTTETRSVKLTWNVPRLNGNAAKYYEVLIKDTEDHNWTILENAIVNQKRLNKTLSYESTVNNLSPFSTYQFGVQAVNNTTRNIHVGDRITLETTTKRAPPDKPLKPIAVEPIMGKPLFAEIEIKMLTKEQMNGSPVDKVIIECEHNEETKCSEVVLTAEQHVQNTNTMLTIDLPNLQDPQIKTYWFRTRMKNGEGRSPSSDAFLLPVSKLQPGPPKNIQISDITAHTLQVKWEEPDIHPALVTHYSIEYTAIQSHRHSITKSISVKSDVKEYAITNLYSSREYCIKVIAVATKRSEPILTNATTPKIYPGAPSSLFADRIGTNSVKVRWRKPEKNPKEVYFYTVRLRAGDGIKAAERNIAEANFPKVKQVRRTKGRSTVFKNLESSTIYTVSVSSYNDNKKRLEDAKMFKVFTTRTSYIVKIVAGIATVPTLLGPVAVQYALGADDNIDTTDEEFTASADIYPGAPEELGWEPHGKNKIKVDWKLPIHNSEELHHFEVRVSEQSSGRILHKIESYGKSETFTITDFTKCYIVRVTSFNYYKKKQDDAMATLHIVANSHTQALQEIASF